VILFASTLLETNLHINYARVQIGAEAIYVFFHLLGKFLHFVTNMLLKYLRESIFSAVENEHWNTVQFGSLAGKFEFGARASNSNWCIWVINE
jgi:hypothetical protein